MGDIIDTAIYVRVSTDEQVVNGYSIRAQEEKLLSFCKIKEWKVYKVYSDEGISGKSISNRSSLMELISDIKKGIVSNVLVYKIDRLTRSTKDLIDLIELFNKYNCSFNSLCESIDTKTSTGRMFIKIIGIFAEFERENIVERVSFGLERKVREGFTIASNNLSYGYKKERGNKVQEIVEYEANVVNYVFDLYLSGCSFSKIARSLNSLNICTKNGNLWTYKTIKLMLTNVNYIGKVRYGINTDKYFEVDGKHDSIISVDKFNLVKEKLNCSNLKNGIFNDFLHCICGKKLLEKDYYYNSKKGKSLYIRYICNNRLCSFSSISEKKINRLISDFIKEWNFIRCKRNYLKKNILKIIVSDYIELFFLDGRHIKTK